MAKVFEMLKVLEVSKLLEVSKVLEVLRPPQKAKSGIAHFAGYRLGLAFINLSRIKI
ncbi:MAG: hypothetical protein M0P70_06195 [Desulfobulbaceae bacterium]|nr:hypothetical protein [Desulfobulbaceae bacterium]